MELLRKATTRKYIANSNAFLQENAISFYLLGAYMTDGHICQKEHRTVFRIASKDLEWIEKIKTILCPNKPIYSFKTSECYVLEVADVASINWLASYGCVPNKSKTISVDRIIPSNYFPDFIRGLIDGDGCLTSCPYKKVKNNKEYWYTKNTVYLCSASETFTHQIKNMIPSNINCGIYRITPKTSTINGRDIIPTCDQYRLQFNDSNAKKLLQWIYYPNHHISLSRKNKLAQSIIG
jgi:hypothetical protein